MSVPDGKLGANPSAQISPLVENWPSKGRLLKASDDPDKGVCNPAKAAVWESSSCLGHFEAIPVHYLALTLGRAWFCDGVVGVGVVHEG
jgi:hypothetical protein